MKVKVLKGDVRAKAFVEDNGKCVILIAAQDQAKASAEINLDKTGLKIPIR